VHEDERVSFETFARAALAIAAALRAFVRERIAAYKVPVRIVMMRETLPRNANGKIVKAALRALFGDAA
jgi:long-chain acyl-CoA synthetase